MFKTQNKITAELLVTDIVTANYRTAEVFRKYNIDFCCGGKMSLIMACKLQAIDESELLEDLGEFAIIYRNAKQWPVDFMINYLINIHHDYFKNNDPIVYAYIDRFITSHSKKYQELLALPILAGQLSGTLNELVSYESSTLFPYIKRVTYAHINNEAYGKFLIQSLHKLSADGLEQYHAKLKLILIEIERVTGNFKLPENACTTHKVMIQKIQEFADYIYQHIFFEKEILIPVTLQMEKTLLEKDVRK